MGLGGDEARVSRRLRAEFLRGRGVVQVSLQDPFVDEHVLLGRNALRVEALAGDRLSGSVLVQGELRRADPLANFLAERRESRQHGPGTEPAADLIGQRSEDERIENDRVTARLPCLWRLREGRDPTRLVPAFLELELRELRSTRDPVSA